VVETATGVKAFAGPAPDLFAGDAMALGEFRTALFEKGRFDPDVFQSWKNFFAVRNIPSLELEARGATPLIGQGVVRGWAAASLYGRAPETQVDIPRFSAQIASVAARLTRLGVCGRPRGLCASTDRATLPGDGTLSLARVATEGEVLDVLAQSKRNKHAALKLMRKLLNKYSLVPERMTLTNSRIHLSPLLPRRYAGRGRHAA
jgi:hypothetical protein